MSQQVTRKTRLCDVWANIHKCFSLHKALI